MAYLRPIVSKCRGVYGHACAKRVTVELIDRWNGTLGEYCQGCGTKALKRQQANESPQPRTLTATEKTT